MFCCPALNYFELPPLPVKVYFWTVRNLFISCHICIDMVLWCLWSHSEKGTILLQGIVKYDAEIGNRRSVQKCAQKAGSYVLNHFIFIIEWWRNAFSDWWKIEGVFCINRKILWRHMYLYNDYVKVWNNPAFNKRVKLSFSLLNCKNGKERKTIATMRHAHWCSFPSFSGNRKNIRFIS